MTPPAIRPYVSARAQKDVFILGAGFSKAIHDRMPVLGELRNPVAYRVARTQPIIRTIPFMDTDVELAMSFLSQRHAWLREADYLRNKALALDVGTAIAEEIGERQAVALADFPDGCQWLGQLVHHLHRHRATIVTFNYDTLLERAFESLQPSERSSGILRSQLQPDIFASENGGFVIEPTKVPTAQLLKLHGSIDWFYSGRASYFGEQIRRTPRGHVPLIVPPSTDNAGYFEHEGMR
jgi:SIR2-like domain